RVLKPDGKAVIINWNLLNNKIAKRFNIKESMKITKKNGFNERDVFVGWKATPGENVMRFIHVFSKDEMKILSKQIGFSKIKIENYSQLGKKEKNGEEQAIILIK
ncbi:MAG: hypothetical protein Q7J14_00430, partial [Candidatus Magasanikbacteria bacterium]|nr:hypothetical protein [Candidatus Magasanikbacteria bacterium]